MSTKELPNACILRRAAGASAVSSSVGKLSQGQAPPTARVLSLASLRSARHQPSVCQTCTSTCTTPQQGCRCLTMFYPCLPNVDTVRHRMQKAKTNLISFSLTNPLGMLSILSSTCDSRFLWFPASHFRGTRGASSQPQPHDRQLDGRATEDPSPIRHIRCSVALPCYSSLPWREEHLKRPARNGHMVVKI